MTPLRLLAFIALTMFHPMVIANSAWTDIDDAAMRANVNYAHRLVGLNTPILRAQLAGSPLEFSNLQGNSVTLPLPNGTNGQFEVHESPMLSDELAAQYPDVKTYRVMGIDDPGASGRIGISQYGFHGLLHTRKGAVYLDSTGSGNLYRSYFKRDYAVGMRGLRQSFSCGLTHQILPGLSPVAEFRYSLKTEGPRKNYRIAVAATGEYTTVVTSGTGDANVALNGPNGIVAAINRVNQIYNRDLNIHLTLVSGTSIVYTNGATDPYSNNMGFTMLSQNQTNLSAEIGSANYDVGHVFSTGGGGVAGLGVVCNDSAKARGVTGLPNPTGDPFFIDFVSHEIGHQFNAPHTFNGTTGNCIAPNRVGSSAFEPGSGSTIMAYAGICADENIQNFSDATFHAGSIETITNFVTSGAGTCNTTIASSNTAPVVNAGNNFTIPGETPFTLTGSANDPEMDTMLFQWDEMDLGTETNLNSIGTDIGDNPLFRSFEPATDGNVRHLPNLTDLLNNDTTIGETLPGNSRTLNFRLTARDQNGGVDADDVQVTVDNSAGPFRVTQPNTAMTLDTNQQQAIEWDVACSDQGDVNCANVDIQVSIDGGATFNTILAATPNDGSALTMLTPFVAAAARIRVVCSDNAFFDVADADVVFATGTGEVLTETGNPQNLTCGTSGGGSLPSSSGSSATSSSSGGGSSSVGFVSLILFSLAALVWQRMGALRMRRSARTST
ncbi:MAG: reprolysin-like metallopeptidase [Pseudomonadota bacterium]